MSDNHIFLSDVHYGAFVEKINNEIQRDLIDLIGFCIDNNIKLHILGDFFDYWMEYPNHYPELGAEILDMLRTYMASNGSILYITGNHDNWTKDYLSDIGFDIESEYRILTIGQYSVFLLHGDGLKDSRFKLPRPWFHRILRNPLFVRLYQTILRPSKGIRLMKWFSDYNRARPQFNPDRLTDWAKEFLSKNDVNFVISGHDHFPRVETYYSGSYINCGTFYSHRSMVQYTNGHFELVKWDSINKQTTPFQGYKTSDRL